MSSSTSPEKRYTLVIRKWWWLLLLLPLLAGMVTYIVFRNQPDTYQAETQLVIGPGVDSPDPDYNTLRASGQLLQTYKGIVSTDTFLQSVLTDLKLEDLSVDDLRNMIDVQADTNSLTLTISVTSPTPRRAVDIANSIANNLFNLSPANPSNPAAISREQSKTQADQLSVTVQETQNRITVLEAELEKLNLLDPAVNTAINDKLAKAENQLAGLETQYQSAKDVTAQDQLGNLVLQSMIESTMERIQQLDASVTSASPSVQHLVLEQVSSEKDHLSRLQKALSDNQQMIEGLQLDVYIQNEQQSITDLQAKLSLYYDVTNKRFINDQITEARTRLENAGKIASVRQQQVFDQLAEERRRVSSMRSMPVSERDYLSQLISDERDRLTSLQQTHAGLVEAFYKPWTNQVKITQSASTATPVPSNLRLAILAALIGGLALALAAVISIGYFDNSFQTIEDLEQAIGVPSLGALHKDSAFLVRGASPEQQLVTRNMPVSAGAEEYRLLAARLTSQLHKVNQAPGQAVTLMISGLNSDENAGQVASNLGIVLAQTGQSVLLIDANMKYPALSRLFKLPDETGLTTILSNPEGKTQLKLLTVQHNLSVMPSGPLPVDAFGLLASNQFPIVLGELKKYASVILVAASPLMSAAESFVLASNVDGVILVTSEEKINRTEVEAFVKALSNNPWNILGTISVLRQSMSAVYSLPPAWLSGPSRKDASKDSKAAKTSPEKKQALENVTNIRN